MCPHEPGEAILDTFGIGSTTEQNRSAVPKSVQPDTISYDTGLLLTCFWYSSGSLGRQFSHTAASAELVSIVNVRRSDILLKPRSGVLQPMQVTVFTANFINPPIVGVAICIVRV